jgi:hypothetical protein
MATQELVVPKSMPITFAMFLAPQINFSGKFKHES